MSIMLFEFRLRDFFVLQPFSEILSTSTSVLDSISLCGSFGIAFVLQQFRPNSTSCISDLQLHWRDLCPWSTRVPLTILLSIKQCDPQLLRSGAKDLVRRWTCWFHQIFASSASSDKKIGKKISCGFSSRHKENLTRTKAYLRSGLAIKQQDLERFTYANKISHRDSHYMWQLAANFN